MAIKTRIYIIKSESPFVVVFSHKFIKSTKRLLILNSSFVANTSSWQKVSHIKNKHLTKEKNTLITNFIIKNLRKKLKTINLPLNPSFESFSPKSRAGIIWMHAIECDISACNLTLDGV